MKAAILVEQHRPLVVDDVTLPQSLAPGQVLVQVHFSGVCGSQLGEIDGVKGEDRYLPHLLGHEGGAVVLETGPGVRYVKEGDPVVMHWREGAGMAAPPPTYTWGGKALNAGYVTTFNEFAIVSENRLTPIPQNFDLGLAALFGCPVTTGLGVVAHDAKLTIGESIVVMGAGGVGLSVVQGAALAGAQPIVAVDRYDSKLALAMRLGATHAINVENAADEGEVAEQVRAVVGAAGADVVVENTGDVRVIEQAYALASAQGRVVLVGVPRAGQHASLATLPLHFGKAITGSHGGQTQPQRDIPRYLRLCAAGKLKLAPLITDRFPLEEINTAIDRMRCGAVAGRCLIEMSQQPR